MTLDRPHDSAEFQTFTCGALLVLLNSVALLVLFVCDCSSCLVSVGFFGVVGEDLVGFGQQEWGAGFSCACNARDCVRGVGEWVG